MVINDKLIGKTFFVDNMTGREFTCQGFAFTGTIIVFGSTWDQVNNRTRIDTFKLSEVKFVGNIQS